MAGDISLRSQVSAIRSLVRVSRFRCRFGLSSVICHRFSHRPIILFSPQLSPPRCPPFSPRALRSSKTLSGPRSRPSGPWYGYSGAGPGSGNLPSVLCHRFSPLLRPLLSPPFSPPSCLSLSLPIRQPLTAIRYHLPHLLSSCPLFHPPSIFSLCPPFSLRSKSVP